MWNEAEENPKPIYVKYYENGYVAVWLHDQYRHRVDTYLDIEDLVYLETKIKEIKTNLIEHLTCSDCAFHKHSENFDFICGLNGKLIDNPNERDVDCQLDKGV